MKILILFLLLVICLFFGIVLADIPVSDNMTSVSDNVSSVSTPKPVYKESVGSVYEADYQEPQPMTFTSYPTCS